eukprot:Ihof_evm1s293 gene=Ihof_evmTU1s293
MSARLNQFKKAGLNMAEIREKKREQLAGLRKQNRDKVIARKRLRQDDDKSDVEQEREEVLDDKALKALSEQVSLLVKTIQNNQMANKEEPLRDLRKLLARHTSLVNVFLDIPESVQLLLDLMMVPQENIQLEALWCVTNMSAGESEQTKCMLQTSPILIGFLSGSSAQHQDLAAWALGNMAADGPDLRNVLLSQGILTSLASLLENSATPPHVLEAVAFALSNLARGGNVHIEAFVEAKCVSAAIRQWKKCVALPGGPGVISELCWFLTYLTAKDKSVCANLVQDGLLPLLGDVLATIKNCEFPAQAITPALRVMGNILSGDDQYTTVALSMPFFLPAITDALQSPYRYIRSEGMWVLSNITAGSNDHAKVIASEDLSAFAVTALNDEPVVLEQALYVLCNLADHGSEFVDHLIQLGAMKGVIRVLRSSNPNLAHQAMQFLEISLRLLPEAVQAIEEQDGVEALEQYQYHDNKELSTMAVTLIEKYFYDL